MTPSDMRSLTDAYPPAMSRLGTDQTLRAARYIAGRVVALHELQDQAPILRDLLDCLGLLPGQAERPPRNTFTKQHR